MIAKLIIKYSKFESLIFYKIDIFNVKFSVLFQGTGSSNTNGNERDSKSHRLGSPTSPPRNLPLHSDVRLTVFIFFYLRAVFSAIFLLLNTLTDFDTFFKCIYEVT